MGAQDEAERATTHLAALRARDDFLSMASHELKTPMKLAELTDDRLDVSRIQTSGLERESDHERK